MLRTILAGALASGALLAGGGAHAQDYGYGGYGQGGYGVGVGAGVNVGEGGGYGGYAPYRPHGFTLAGVRAGVTVLGVDVDGSAKLTVGAHGWDHGGGYAQGGRATSYAPYPQPGPPPMSPPPGYWMGYSAPTRYVMSYDCGCAPPPPPCCRY